MLQSIDGIDYRIVLVDDGSGDDTLATLNRLAADDPRLLVYAFSRNFGHQVALSAGLDVARGDAVVLMDSDLQHPPRCIVKMVEHWRGGADVVSMVRRTTADASAFKNMSSRGFYWLINLLSETRIEPGVADFCLLSTRAAGALRRMPERHRFLRGMVAWIGFERVFEPYEAAPRAAGASKYSMRKMMALALDAAFSFSTRPMRLVIRVGMLFIAFAVAYMSYTVGRWALLGDLVPGWASMICLILLVGGIQMVFTGVVGEFVARVFEESKGRPLYIFSQTPGDVPGAPRESDSQAQAQTTEVVLDASTP